jgi:S1-C subfamily serine protease
MRKQFFATLFLVCMGALGYITYTLYWTVHEQQFVVEQLKNSIGTIAQTDVPQSSPVNNAIYRWNDLQPKLQDTVVQIFPNIVQFNWLEPYKSPNQMLATGSGFFIDDQGHIITNAHVVDQARSVTIQIPSFGKRRFEVDIIGVSPDRDLALLKLKDEEKKALEDSLGSIKFLPLSNSDQVHRAEEIMALGYPLSQQSLKSTTGVVSGQEHLEGHFMLQISAPINPGSSGGPCLNMKGEVIGVSRAGIYGGAQNVGYIIPSNEVALFLKQLEAAPIVNGVKLLRKPFIGVFYCNATPALTQFLGNPLPGGLYVVETYKGGPLQKAGVLPGDMIYEINGCKLDNFGEMEGWNKEDRMTVVDFVARLTIGEKVNMVIYRKGTKKNISFTFNQSEVAAIRAMNAMLEPIDFEIVGGMVVMQLALNHLPSLIQVAPDLAKYMDFRNQMEPRLVVTHIFPDSAIFKSRTFGPGTILKEVNGKEVKTLDEFREAVKLSIQNNYLTLKTSENLFTVLLWDKVVQDEPKLAKYYLYTITPFMKEFLAVQK